MFNTHDPKFGSYTGINRIKIVKVILELKKIQEEYKIKNKGRLYAGIEPFLLDKLGFTFTNTFKASEFVKTVVRYSEGKVIPEITEVDTGEADGTRTNRDKYLSTLRSNGVAIKNYKRLK